MAIKKQMFKYYLDKITTLPDAIDIIFSAKWRKPEGKEFDKGSWCDLTLLQQKILYMFEVPGMDKLTSNIKILVQNDTDKRKGKTVKRGRKRKV